MLGAAPARRKTDFRPATGLPGAEFAMAGGAGASGSEGKRRQVDAGKKSGGL